MRLEFYALKYIGREKMAFREHLVTVDEFLHYAIRGHSFRARIHSLRCRQG